MDRVLVALGLLAAALCAQTTRVLPPDCAQRDGTTGSVGPFAYSTARCQQLIAGGALCRSSCLLTALAYRRDGAASGTLPAQQPGSPAPFNMTWTFAVPFVFARAQALVYGAAGAFSGQDAYSFACEDPTRLIPGGQTALKAAGLLQNYPALAQAEGLWSGSMPVRVPNDPWLAGASIYGQAWFVHPASNALGLVTSSGLALTLGAQGPPMQVVGNCDPTALTGSKSSTPTGQVTQFTGVFN